jgi:hypothetical protein
MRQFMRRLTVLEQWGALLVALQSLMAAAFAFPYIIAAVSPSRGALIHVTSSRTVDVVLVLTTLLDAAAGVRLARWLRARRRREQSAGWTGAVVTLIFELSWATLMVIDRTVGIDPGAFRASALAALITWAAAAQACVVGGMVGREASLRT